MEDYLKWMKIAAECVTNHPPKEPPKPPPLSPVIEEALEEIQLVHLGYKNSIPIDKMRDFPARVRALAAEIYMRRIRM